MKCLQRRGDRCFNPSLHEAPLHICGCQLGSRWAQKHRLSSSPSRSMATLRSNLHLWWMCDFPECFLFLQLQDVFPVYPMPQPWPLMTSQPPLCVHHPGWGFCSALGAEHSPSCTCWSFYWAGVQADLTLLDSVLSEHRWVLSGLTLLTSNTVPKTGEVSCWMHI